MTQNTPNGRSTLKPPTANNRTAVGNGSKLLNGIDGRSTIARRFREIAAELDRINIKPPSSMTALKKNFAN